MTPEERHFRLYEQTIQGCVESFNRGEPVTISVRKGSTSHARQQLRKAMEVFVHDIRISSPVRRDDVSNLLSTWCFSDGFGKVFIGPRGTGKKKLPPALAFEGGNVENFLPPVDCSDTAVLNALALLKNRDVFPFPIPILHASPEAIASLEQIYPNISFSEVEGKLLLL